MSSLHRNNVCIPGRGDAPLLFLHGFGCDQTIWNDVAPAFQASHQTILMDFVGAGGSDSGAYNDAKYRSLDGHAEDVVEVLSELRVAPATVVAHSAGASIALLAAARHASLIDRLVLIGPSPCYLNEPGYAGGFEREDVEALLRVLDENLALWSHNFAPVLMGHADRPWLANSLAERFCRLDAKIARDFARATFLSDIRRVLPRVATPTVILQCAEDPIAPPAVGRYLMEQLPNAKLHLLRTPGHCPHVSGPQEVIEVLTDCLEPQSCRS
jgi:sigma-B regulation protein RsbQ